VNDQRFSHATLREFAPIPDGEEQYPLEYMDANRVIKLREDGQEVIVGICEPDNASLLASLREFHDKPVIFRLIDRSELFAYLGKKLSLIDAEPHAVTADEERLRLDRLANDAPIVNLVNSLMIEAIRKGASDIHLESFPEEARVRYRVDGVLQVVARFEKEKFPAVSSRIKIMANLNIMERRLPQDGRISVHLGGGAYDVRVSIVPIADGESVVLRLFNTEGKPLGLEQLGLDGRSIAVLRQLIAAPHGLVLATGPTGSGKTTTLNALLRELASEAVKVITIEDPVEYRIAGVDQIQTHERIGLTFESMLKRVLRQDPDIIMVGEIRDTPTAEIALRAALTGHLVLSTLHTNDAVSVIPRLRNMGVEPYLIAAVLRGALAQRLVRKVCDACRRSRKIEVRERAVLREHGLSAPQRLIQGAGCDECSGTGYRGRTAVVELFRSDPTVENLILRGEQVSAITAHLEARGFRSLARNGLALALQGVTTIAEVERAVQS
jgi:type II secretory ATPase GspE/PulE/Tfp pilus assembly ATPase PilB-like protein